MLEAINDEVIEIREGLYATRNGEYYGVVDKANNIVFDRAGKRAIYRDNYVVFNVTNNTAKLVFLKSGKVLDFDGVSLGYGDGAGLIERTALNFKIIEVVSNGIRHIIDTDTGDILVSINGGEAFAYRPIDKIIYSVKINKGGYKVVTDKYEVKDLDIALSEVYVSIKKLTGKKRGYEVVDEDGNKHTLTAFGQLY